MGQKQLYRRIHAADAPRYIDAGGDGKGNGFAAACGQISLGVFGQRDQSGAVGVGQYLQSQAGKGTVFAGQRYHIGQCRNGDQIAVLGEQKFLCIFALDLLFDRRNKFKGHGGAAEVTAGAGVVLKGGIDQSIGGGKLRRQRMVIGHNHLDTGFLGASDFLQRGNAVIHRDDQLDPGEYDHFHRLHRKAVALIEALRDIIADIGALALQIFIQQHRCGNAVTIVIAENKDFFAILHRPAHNGGCLFHIMQRQRVTKRLGAIEESLGRCGGGDAAGGQYPAKEHRQRPVPDNERFCFGKILFPCKKLHQLRPLLSFEIKYYTILHRIYQSPGGQKRSITAPAVWMPSTALLMMPPA